MTKQDYEWRTKIESAIRDAIRAGNTARKLVYDATGEMDGRRLTSAEKDMLEFASDTVVEKLLAVAKTFYGDNAENVAGLADIAL